MAVVFIPSQLREAVGGRAQLEIAAATVRQVVEQLEAAFPGVRGRLRVGDALAPALQVAIDGQFSARGLDAKLAPHSELHFLPVFGGG